MLSKNLRYYRLKNHLSRKELAEMINVTPMSISNYENGERRPFMDIIKALANALNVKISDFLVNQNENLVFAHGEFRKGSKLTDSQQDFIRASVEEYMNRFFSAVDILGGEVLPTPPICHAVALSTDVEEDAKALRRHFRLSEMGPIGNLVEMLENKGILLCFLDIDNDAFSGMNGLVGERPYIVINNNMSPERIRFTIVHEMSHFVFAWPDGWSEDEIEKRVNSISGAFLLSEEDAKRELGIQRKYITRDMEMICREYGISMYALVKRARICGIISENTEKKFYISAAQQGWRKNEPIRIAKEEPTLFPQLVFRAVSEGEISIQKGAELLRRPYNDVAQYVGKIE